MRFLLVSLTIFSFLAMGVFGVFVMNHSGEHSYGCLSSIAKGTDCPVEVNPASFFIFHLDVFKSFTTAVVSDAFLAALMTLAVLALFSIFNFLSGNPFKKLSADLFFRIQNFVNPLTPATEQEKLVSWFSLHENSPSFN